MKRNILALFMCCLFCTLTGCGGSSGSKSSSTPQTPPEPLSEREVKMMYSDPQSYVGSVVELTGQVFSGVEYDDEGVYFQLWADPENFDLNTVVAYKDPDFELEGDDYVRLTGKVVDVFEGENMMGGTITAPAILASKVEILSYKDAVMPTIATATATNATIDQLGYAVTIQSVELAEKETRVYISIQNNGSNEFTLYGFNSVLIQDSTQYEYQPNYTADYPEHQTQIRPGITTEGVLVFPAIREEPFQIILEGSTYDWNEDIGEYVFNCTVSSVDSQV